MKFDPISSIRMPVSRSPVALVRPTRARLTLAVLALACSQMIPTALRADEGASHLAFSDPAKPGVLKIRLWYASVSIHGADVPDVTVSAGAAATHAAPRSDGLRVLTSKQGYTLTEKDNVMNLDYGWGVQAADFDLTVPRSTSVVVTSSIGGNVACADLAGDIEIHGLNGRIDLADLLGGALVETVNGQVRATVKELHDGRPLSFTSMNGKIVILVPPEAKATVRFRTHNGAILTDFDERQLITKTEVSRRTPRPPRAGAPGAAAPALPPAPPVAPPALPSAAAAPAAPAPGAAGEDDWKDEVKDSVRELAEEIRAAAEEAAAGMRAGLATRPGSSAQPARPLPPMTGGKVVSGTLNGGGTEIQASTMNGDITLRKLTLSK